MPDQSEPAGTATLVGVAGDPGPPGGGSPEVRLVARQGVLWAARLEFGGATLDCVVLDISARGARLRFAAPVTVPDRVILHLRDGTRYEARRRWTRGTQIGLALLGPGAAVPPDQAAAQRARAVLQRLEACDPAAWLPGLRAERHFGDTALREAAEAAETAHLRLLAALRRHVPGA